jgi:outer membrane protein W
MKKNALNVLLIFFFCMIQAQEKDKFRVGFDFGYAFADKTDGFSINMEPKYNISDNMNVGLRLKTSLLFKNIVISDKNEIINLEASVNSSVIGTFDYYYRTNSKFNPYLGAGVGYTYLENVKVENQNALTSTFVLDAKNSFVVMGRVGFELGKFRMGLEYNYIPDSTMINRVVGTFPFQTVVTDGKINNSYFVASLGFYLGGGKWNN